MSETTIQAINAAFAQAADGLRAALTASQLEAARLAGEADRVQTELETLQAATAASNTASHEHIRQLQAQAEEMHSQLARQTTELNEGGLREAELQNQLEAAMGRLAVLDAEREEQNLHAVQLAAEHVQSLARLRTEAATLEQRLQAESAARHALDGQLAELRRLSEQQRVQWQLSKQTHQEQALQMAELNAVIQLLREKEVSLHETLRRQADAARAAEAAAATVRDSQVLQVGQLEGELASLRKEAEEQRHRLARLSEQLDASITRNEQLQSRHREQLENQAADFRTARSRAALAAEEADLRARELHHEITRLRTQSDRERARQDREMRTAQAQLHGARAQAQWLNLTSERLQTRIDEGQARERSLLEQWQSLRTEAAALRQQIELAASHGPPVAPAPQASVAVTPSAESAVFDLPAGAAEARAHLEQEAYTMTKELPDIQHVNQLLALRDARFVGAAYRSILGREPETDGLAFHLGRVRTVRDKVAVVYHLATSVEGARRPQHLPGLRELLAEQDPRRGRIARWLQRMAMSFSTVRRVEVALDSVAEELTERLDEVEGRLDRLGRQLAESAEATRHDIHRLRDLLDSRFGEFQPMVAASQAAQAAAAASGEQLAALPTLLDDRLEALFQRQHQALLQALNRWAPSPSQAPTPGSPAEPPCGPPATAMELDAAPGAVDLLRKMASALALTPEAALLARNDRT